MLQVNFARDPTYLLLHEFITYVYILYCLSSINFQLSYNLAGFLDILNYTNGGLEQPKRQIPMFNDMAIHTRRQTNVSKQRYWMALALVLPNSLCVGVA